MFANLETTQTSNLIAFTVLFYDHLLTLPTEVRNCWRRSHYSVGLVLFFVNRYFALCIHILNVTRVFIKEWPNNNICGTLQLFERAGVILIQVFCAIIMGMRVYAFYGKSRRILAFLCIIALGVLGFSVWALFFDHSGEDDLAPVCYIYPALALRTALVWTGQLVFDAVIFVLTVWRSYCIGKVSSRVLVGILLRDGSIYFAVISGVNAATMLVLLLASPPYKSVTGTFNNALNVIMVSRLVLNMQEPDCQGSVENAEGTIFMMTTFAPLDDVALSMCIDNSDPWTLR